MKRVRTVMNKLPLNRIAGEKISKALDAYFEANPGVEDKIFDAVRLGFDGHPIDDETEKMIARVLGDAIGCTDFKKGKDSGYSSDLRVALIAAWRRASSDPDDQVEQWLREGGPLGIRKQPLDRGIFPQHDEETQRSDPECLLDYAAVVDGDVPTNPVTTKKPSDELIMVALDFKDAFFQVPVLPEERPFLAAKLRNKYVVFERAARVRGAPPPPVGAHGRSYQSVDIGVEQY